jgi:hypothetical protein
VTDLNIILILKINIILFYIIILLFLLLLLLIIQSEQNIIRKSQFQVTGAHLGQCTQYTTFIVTLLLLLYFYIQTFYILFVVHARTTC